MENKETYLKGRGAQINTPNPYHNLVYDQTPIDWSMAEEKMEITRSLLEVLWKYRHPVGIITKNSLIMRDLDILEKMNKHNLVHVALSITTLDEKLRMLLEPRTATIQSRLRTLEKLSSEGIPCNVMMAPIIPGLNDHEIFQMVKTVAALGARSIGYTMVRLNGDVAEIFTDWIRKTMPDRADKVLNKIKECHGGSLEDKRFGKRMSGEGNIAKIISKQFKVAKEKFMKGQSIPPYNCEMHEDFKSPQLKLF